MIADWPTVGHDAERSRVDAALRSRTEQHGVVIVGDAGVGKTTLAREAIARRRRRHPATVYRWAAGTESSAGIPLGAFAHLVRVDDTAQPAEILRSAESTLTGGRDTPVLLAVDDAHLLDPLSATLLHQLVLGGSARFVVTVRSGGPCPGAVTALWKDGLLRRVELGTLAPDELRRITRTALGGPVEEATGERLATMTGGNALYLRLVVTSAVTAGALRCVDGVWRLRGDIPAGSELTALIAESLADATPGVLEVLRVLSFEEVLPLDVVGAIVDPADVERAESAGYVSVSPRGPEVVARLAHPMFGHVIRATSALLTRRRVVGAIVAALADQPPAGPSDRIRRTILAMDSDTPPSPDALVSAAQSAQRLGDVALAEHLARAATTADPGSVAAVVTLANAVAWQGRGHEAEEVLATLEPEGLAEADLLAWLLPGAAARFWTLSDADGAFELVAAHRSRFRSEQATSTVDALESAFHLYSGDPRTAVAVADRALSVTTTPRGLAWAATMSAMAHAVAGDRASAQRMTQMARPALDAADGMLRYTVGLAEITSALGRGDLTEAASIAADLRAAAGTVHPGRSLADVLVHIVAIENGDLGAAADGLRDASAAVSGTGYSWEFLAVVHRCRAAAAAGRHDEASAALQRAERLSCRSVALFAATLEIARAQVALGAGDRWQAAMDARRAATLAAASGLRVAVVDALHLAARAGDADVVADLRTAVDALSDADPSTADRGAVLLDHARAVATRDPVGLDRVAARLAERGAFADAADIASAAADLHLAAGARGDAFTSAEAARRHAARCGKPTVSTAGRRRPPTFTAREWEIASMVAIGMSNRAIADRLTVSVRTVEGHVYRACAKVGVEDRAGLGRIVAAAPHPVGVE